MSDYLFRSMLDLVVLVLGALLLSALMRGVVSLLQILPVRQGIRDAVGRLAPLVGVTVAIAYATSAVAVLLARDREFATVLVALIVVLAAFAWAPLYDLVSGVAFRMGRVCREGDVIQVGDIEGRVLRVGLRALVVTTRSGDEAVVPYGKIGRGALRRSQSVRGAHLHTFFVDLPPDEAFPAVKQRLVRAALRCHWASVIHEPKVVLAPDGRAEVSVYALDADHAPALEAAVRRVLDARRPGPVTIPRFPTPTASPSRTTSVD